MRHPSIRNVQNGPRLPSRRVSRGRASATSAGVTKDQTSVSRASRSIFPRRRSRLSASLPRSASRRSATLTSSSHRKYGRRSSCRRSNVSGRIPFILPQRQGTAAVLKTPLGPAELRAGRRTALLEALEAFAFDVGRFVPTSTTSRRVTDSRIQGALPSTRPLRSIRRRSVPRSTMAVSPSKRSTNDHSSAMTSRPERST